MSKDFLQDSVGDKSSKRLGGIALISSGILFSWALFVFSLFYEVKDPETALRVINLCLLPGFGLLGLGLAEKFAKK